jgi:predicted RNase H-like HicB family nuclease
MHYKVVLEKSEEGYSVSCPVLPGCNPVNAFTMGGIITDAGIMIEEFKKLL